MTKQIRGAQPEIIEEGRASARLFPFAISELHHVHGPAFQFKVRLLGQFRSPKAGEWYISGAIPEGYRATQDISNPYHIAELVEVEKVEAFRVLRKAGA